MQVKFLLSLPARSHWYQPRGDPKFNLANLRIDIYNHVDHKFNWMIISDGYEPKILSRVNHIEESCLTFAIKQEEETAVNFYWQTSLAQPTKDGFRKQPSCDRVPKSILESIIPTKEIPSPANCKQILRAVEQRLNPYVYCSFWDCSLVLPVNGLWEWSAMIEDRSSSNWIK